MSKNSKKRMRISITILPSLNKLLEELIEKNGESKSSLIEQAIKVYLEQKMEKDLQKLAKMKFDDLPTEEDWLKIQNG
ncbi:CopG family transcriptional regulator [Candidatus Peregrinibacteria bacterium]|nr:CopG family transcriptional regulator [Candidatus Peregrinibacteria bacterium]